MSCLRSTTGTGRHDVPVMPYDVQYTDEFKTWWHRLTVPQQEEVRPS